MPGPVDALLCWENVVCFHLNRQINENSGNVPEVFGGSRSWTREWLWHSPRQTSVAEVVTGWLSCEGEEKGKTKHICGVERTRLPGGGQKSRRGGRDCGTQGSSLGM